MHKRKSQKIKSAGTPNRKSDSKTTTTPAKSDTKPLKVYKKKFEVEEIVDEKVENGQTLFYLKWKNYSSKVNTWEPEKHLENSRDLIDEYRRKRAENASKIQKTPKSKTLTPKTGGSSAKNDSRSSSKVVSRSSSEVGSRLSSKVNSRSSSKIDSRSPSKVTSRLSNKVDSNTRTESDSKSSSKVDSKLSNKEESRLSKGDSRTSTKDDSKSSRSSIKNIKITGGTRISNSLNRSDQKNMVKERTSSVKEDSIRKSAEIRSGSRSNSRKVSENLKDIADAELDGSSISLSLSNDGMGEKHAEASESKRTRAPKIADEQTEGVTKKQPIQKIKRRAGSGMSDSQNGVYKTDENFNNPTVRLEQCGDNSVADSAAYRSRSSVRSKSDTSYKRVEETPTTQDDETVDSDQDFLKMSFEKPEEVRRRGRKPKKRKAPLNSSQSDEDSVANKSSRDMQYTSKKSSSKKRKASAVADENANPNILAEKSKKRSNSPVSSKESQEKVFITENENTHLIPEEILEAEEEGTRLKFLVSVRNSDKKATVYNNFLAKKYPQVLLDYYEARVTWNNR